MQTTAWSRIPQTIGSPISYEYYRQLVTGYAQQHPTEQKSIFIPKEFILETLDSHPNVTGLRFMYGQQEGADPSSRTIVLIPCNDTSVDGRVPNLILVAEGYLTDSGERVTLDQCWELFTRHVARMCELIPGLKRKSVPRACFFGIDSVKSLLDTPDCAGINYHFGYNPDTRLFPDRYETVMEAVDVQRHSLNMFVDIGQRCPTMCDDGGTIGGPLIPVTWPITGSKESDQDGPLFEMFHYVNPPLFVAIQDKEAYKEHFSECQALVAEGNFPMARTVLRKELELMMEQYLGA